MARSFIIWLHGLGDSGPANEPIKSFFSSPEFKNTVWSFPTAPSNSVSCNNGRVMHSWFDIYKMPVKANSQADEEGLLNSVQTVHALIDKEIATGIDPKNVFVCGLSQGGALTLASVLLYPKTLGGGAVFSGWVPFKFSSSLIKKFQAKGRGFEPPLDQSNDLCKGPWRWVERALSSIRKKRLHSDAKTPILWCHGKIDTIVLFEAGQAGPPFIKQAGLSCEFKAYPNLGHTISDEELLYLEEWIKKRLQSCRK